ncbi:MAG: hypothetical protein HOE44_12265 [Candidatus Marinimicrobia bacterium]|jgi:hypothetical protein|nr:hypothetical protein [Candidatus Neomarinimicrobiota bacterium]
MVIDVNGPDGNAFQIIKFVKQLFKETDRMDEWGNAGYYVQNHWMAI